MAEYIEREALKERFRKRIKWLKKDVHDQYSLGLFHGCEYDADLINEPPAADVAPVQHGRWEYYDTYIDGITIFRCTCCGDLQSGRYGWGWKKNYCPNCGAKMDLEE